MPSMYTRGTTRKTKKKISISFKEAAAAYSVALNSTTEKYAIRKDTCPSPQARIPLILSIASGQRIIKRQDVPSFSNKLIC